MTRPLPKHYFYQLTLPRGWARIWLTSDGCFTCMSDWGNYSYWWGGVEGEFREFLTECDTHYLGGKLGGGKTEFDADRTLKVIRENICRRRRDRQLSEHVARVEWRRAGSVEDLESYVSWSEQHFDDVGTNERERRDLAILYEDSWDWGCYGVPRRLEIFFEKVWPGFVEALKAELAAERTQTDGV